MLTSLRAGAERKTIITQCTHFTEATLLSLAHSFGKKNVSTVWIDSVETPGGGAPHQFRIGVCRQGSQTLTLFNGRKLRIFMIPFQRPNTKKWHPI